MTSSRAVERLSLAFMTAGLVTLLVLGFLWMSRPSRSPSRFEQDCHKRHGVVAVSRHDDRGRDLFCIAGDRVVDHD